MNILYIDTSSNQEIRVDLEKNNNKEILKKKIGKNKAQVVLPMIDGLLKKNELTINDINQIKVKTGPGSFTGLRVGISIANALGFALNIPVNGNKIGEFVEPEYE